MLVFTVHEPPSPPAERGARAESLVFVKDGFTWAAAVFAPFWLLLNRLWWPLIGYVVILASLNLAQRGIGLDQRWAGLVLTALHLLIGFEAGALRRAQLERRGWRMLGSVTGRNLGECERRFFDTWLPAQPPTTSPPQSVHPPGPSQSRRIPALFGRLFGSRV
jgi:hypothetical protein